MLSFINLMCHVIKQLSGVFVYTSRDTKLLTGLFDGKGEEYKDRLEKRKKKTKEIKIII